MSTSNFPCCTGRLSNDNGRKASSFVIRGFRVCVCQSSPYPVDGVTMYGFYQATTQTKAPEMYPSKGTGVMLGTSFFKLVSVSFTLLGYQAATLCKILMIYLAAIQEVRWNVVTPACLSEVQAHAVSILALINSNILLNSWLPHI